MEYLTMFPESFAAVRRYSPEDRCYLYEAMGEYAFSGQEPDWPEDDLKWYVWELLKQRIDAAKRVSEARSVSGSKGGRPKQAEATESKEKQTKAKESKEKQTEANESKKSSESESESESDTESESERDTNARTRTREEAKVQLARFERFWEAYPRHTDKQRAVKAWGKIRPDDTLLDRMLAAIAQQKQSDQWTRDGGAYIPHPSTWLTQQRWMDEMPKAVPRQQGKTVIAQQYAQRDYSQEAPDDPPEWMMARWQEMQKGGETA